MQLIKSSPILYLHKYISLNKNVLYLNLVQIQVQNIKFYLFVNNHIKYLLHMLKYNHQNRNKNFLHCKYLYQLDNFARYIILNLVLFSALS